MLRKKRLWQGFMLAVLSLVGGERSFQWHARRQFASLPAKPIRNIQASFSKPTTDWLHGKWEGPAVGAAWTEVYESTLNLASSLVRLSEQWDQIETSEGRYDWSDTDALIRRAATQGRKVVLCFGIKNLQWPEWYVPGCYKDIPGKVGQGKRFNLTKTGLRQPYLDFLTTCLKRYGNSPHVAAIQIENEPLEATGDPGKQIDLGFLKEEVALARTLTKKPIWLTMGAGMTEWYWYAHFARPAMLKQLLSCHPDAIGFNIYVHGYSLKKVWGHTGLSEFRATAAHWLLTKRMIETAKEHGINAFISELQMEPWEVDRARVNFTEPFGNASFNPNECRAIFANVQKLGVDTVFLWGVEFQHACKNQGNSLWWETTASLVKEGKQHPVRP